LHRVACQDELSRLKYWNPAYLWAYQWAMQLKENQTYCFERLRCLINNDYIELVVTELPATSGMTCSKDNLQ